MSAILYYANEPKNPQLRMIGGIHAPVAFVIGT
jgi:hypothetical protein